MATYPTTISAVQAMFDANGTLAADFLAAGGLWFGEVPEDDPGVFPVACLLQLEEPPEWNNDSATVQSMARLEFHVFHNNDLAKTEAYAADIMAVFDPNSQTQPTFPQIPLANATEAQIERTNYHVRLAEFRDQNQLPVFECVLSYQVRISKTI